MQLGPTNYGGYQIRVYNTGTTVFEAHERASTLHAHSLLRKLRRDGKRAQLFQALPSEFHTGLEWKLIDV